MNRLIIVEGLPCSGKSSTSRFIADTLRARGRQVRFVDEGTGDHPADYEFHALVDGRVIPLSAFSPEQLPSLLPRKIYDGLPWAEEAPLMLGRWRQFVRCAAADTVHVFNCVLLQNPMCETMMRFNMTQAQSAAHIRQIAEIITPMEPLVVYLENRRIAHSVQQAAQERPGWLEAVTGYHVSGGYGRSIGASGFEGYIACLEERQRRELAILRSLTLESIILPDPQANWPSALQKLAALL